MNLTGRSTLTKKIRDLVVSSYARRYDDLATMLDHSTDAVALVEAAPTDLPAALVVAAWTQHGNALRVTGRYDEAERSLDQASARAVSGSPTSIHLLEVKASLHRNTGRYDSAARLLDSVPSSIRNPAGEARRNDLLGLVHLDAGDRPQALQCFSAALDLLTPASPPDLLVSAGHNLFQTLIAAGRLSAASTALAALEPSYRRFTSARIIAKADWMRARLYCAMSQPFDARLAYLRAYALLKTQPLSPDLPDLAEEIAHFSATSPGRRVRRWQGGQS